MFENSPRLAVGYECTPICDAEELFGEPRDVLDATRHYEQFERDFDLQEELGIYELRYPACWDKVLIKPFQYDFAPIAPIMESMQRRGFNPTIDLCHHKPPKKIQDGFANPEFPEHLQHFALEFQKAFPFVNRYTVVNEPAVTALFHSSEVGLWAQHKWSDVFLNIAKAISLASRALQNRDSQIEFFQPEPIDHDALAPDADAELIAHVEFLHQHGRFGMDNLLRGKLNHAHPFFAHLVSKGAAPDKVSWFEKNPAACYQKDLDFYVHCFKLWFRDRDGKITHRINPNPPSLASVIADYRAQMPDIDLGLGETNVRGTVRDRITFLKWILEECAAAGIRRISWWGLTDAQLWGDGNLTRWWRAESAPDPVGIYTLTNDAEKGALWNREPNEFSEIIKAYSNGQITAAEIPVYEFCGELKDALNGFKKRHMQHWKSSPATSSFHEKEIAVAPC